MKVTLYAASTDSEDMFISVHEDGIIIYAWDSEIYDDLHDAFCDDYGAYSEDRALAWLRTVEDDSAFTVYDPEMAEVEHMEYMREAYGRDVDEDYDPIKAFWDCITVIAKIETEL